MLTLQPRKVIFHPNVLVHGWQSVEALIAAAEVVHMEVGPPVQGTYRDDFINYTGPRHGGQLAQERTTEASSSIIRSTSRSPGSRSPIPGQTSGLRAAVDEDHWWS